MFDSPVVSIHIPPALRNFSAGHAEVMASGDTVGEVFEALLHEYPAFRSRLFTADGRLLDGLRVFLGPQNVHELQGLATPVGQEETVSIIPGG